MKIHPLADRVVVKPPKKNQKPNRELLFPTRPKKNPIKVKSRRASGKFRKTVNYSFNRENRRHGYLQGIRRR